jgi:F0F1-type ATP synthase assembly protein I
LGLVKAPQWEVRFHTGHWLTILGYVIGIGAPFNAVIRIVRSYNKAQKKEDHERRPDQHD